MEKEIKKTSFQIWGENIKELGLMSETLRNWINVNSKLIQAAPFSRDINTGRAYEGSLLTTMNEMLWIASKSNSIFYKNILDDNSIKKITLLQHLSKALMFEPNDNAFEKKKGYKWKFTGLPNALRTGERSLLLCLQFGVPFTNDEYEAMTIIDKDKSDSYISMHSSTLASLISQTNDIINAKVNIYKSNNKQNKA